MDDPTGHDDGLAILICLGIVALATYLIYKGEESRVAPVAGGLTVYPTNTLREPGPPYSTTATLNPTLSSLLTATPTGTLPAPQQILQQGSTRTPTVLPTATVSPIDFSKIPEKIGNDYNFLCNSDPMVECSFYAPSGSALQNGLKRLEDLLNLKTGADEFLDNVPTLGTMPQIRKPLYPTGTGVPSVVPTTAPIAPTIKHTSGHTYLLQGGR